MVEAVGDAHVLHRQLLLSRTVLALRAHARQTGDTPLHEQEELVGAYARAFRRSSIRIEVKDPVGQDRCRLNTALAVLLGHSHRTRQHAAARRNFLAVALPQLEAKLDGHFAETLRMVAHPCAQRHRPADGEGDAVFLVRHAVLADVLIARGVSRHHRDRPERMPLCLGLELQERVERPVRKQPFHVPALGKDLSGVVVDNRQHPARLLLVASGQDAGKKQDRDNCQHQTRTAAERLDVARVGHPLVLGTLLPQLREALHRKTTVVAAADVHRHHGKREHNGRRGEQHQDEQEELRVDRRVLAPGPEPERRQLGQLRERKRAGHKEHRAHVVGQELLFVHGTRQQDRRHDERQKAHADTQHPPKARSRVDELRPPARRIHDRHVGANLPEHLQPVELDKRKAVGRHTHDQTDGKKEREVPFRTLLNDRIENRRVGRHRSMPQSDYVNAPHKRKKEEPQRCLGGQEPEEKHRKIELAHAATHEEPEEERQHGNRHEEQQKRRRKSLSRTPDRV